MLSIDVKSKTLGVMATILMAIVVLMISFILGTIAQTMLAL